MSTEPGVDSILYGAAGPRQAMVVGEPWKDLYPVLTPETTGVAEGWFEGYSGWSGTDSWMVRAGSLPTDWITFDEAAVELAVEETLFDERSSWTGEEWVNKLRSCRLQPWDDDPADPKIAFISEHEDDFTIPVKAGSVAAVEALAEIELEHPAEAEWMVEEHGWFMAYVDADKEVFGLIFMNGKDNILARA